MADLENPYQPPTSRVADVPATVAGDGAYAVNGRAVDAGRGWSWISEGFGYFRQSAGLWILLAVIFLALIVALNVIPFIGWLGSTLLVPVLVGGLMAGCQALERGGELELAHLFAGFRRNTGQLMMVGLIGFALTAAAMIPLMLIIGTGFFAAMSGGASAPVLGASAMLAFLIALALFVPINMALWFAPALVMLQGESAPRAIGQSFKGCLKNILPFLIYGVILFVLAMLASIPLALGWLVLAPVVFGSVYAAYRDIFFQS